MADEEEVEALLEAGLTEDAILGAGGGGGGGAVSGGDGGEYDTPATPPRPPRWLSGHRLVLAAIAASAALCGLTLWVVAIVEKHEGLLQ
jgi:hypothetical protein